MNNVEFADPTIRQVIDARGAEDADLNYTFTFNNLDPKINFGKEVILNIWSKL
jgi:hypothetical protein